MDALKKAKTVIVFDVESVGLHGRGFAFGAVVVDLASRRVVDERRAWCEPSRDPRWGTREGHAWVSEHVLPALRAWGAPWTPRAGLVEVRQAFWDLFSHEYGGAKRESTLLAADCAWPVEARFLAACVDDNMPAREWLGPYPLIDISTLLAVAPVDVPRAADEVPEHDPLRDARHSARQMLAALDVLEKQRVLAGTFA